MKFFPIRCPKVVRTIIFFVVLTILTQVGGLIWLMVRKIGKRFSDRWKIQLVINLILYVMVTLTMVPVLARIGGRVALPVVATQKTPLAPRSFLFVLFNRHYVKKDAREVVLQAARRLERAYPGSVVHYLDAGFPFSDYFPMLPHLSHSRGNSVDLAYCYKLKDGSYTKSPSAIGYFLYEGPKASESQPYRNQPSLLRWNFNWLQWLNRNQQLDRDRTRALLKYFLEDPRTTRVLLELHLHHRWGIVHHKLDFQQLRAARHDDHMHVSVRKK
jgi:hypothetical protein